MQTLLRDGNRSSRKLCRFFLSFFTHTGAAGILYFLLPLTAGSQTPLKDKPTDISPELKSQVLATLRESSRKFQVVSNDGQMGLPSNVIAYFSSGPQTVFIEKDRLRIVIHEPVIKKQNPHSFFAVEKPADVIPSKFKYNSFSIQFRGSDGFNKIEKGKSFETRRNFFNPHSNGQTKTDVASYEELTLKNVYTGIDLRIYSQEQGQMEFDWIIWPGADPGKIRMQFKGQRSLTLSKQGSLEISLPMGSLLMKIPESYYATPLGKVKSDCRFVIRAKNEVRFKENQKHDSRYPLIIDPNLMWGTFFDGASSSFDEYLYGIEYNYSNNLIYCAGVANMQVSTAYAAALSSGYDGTYSAGQDVLIYALTKNGQTIQYITYLGGSGDDVATGVSIGGSNIFITGHTTSSNLPVTNGSGGTTAAFDNSLGGTQDGFAAVFNTSLNTLSYCTYLGGSGNDEALTIRATSSNSFYVSLHSFSSLPTSSPNYLVSYANNSFSGPADEAWVGKFTSFNTLRFGTYIAGSASSSTTVINDFQLLSDGDVVFVGSTTDIVEVSGTVSSNTSGYDVLYGHINVPASGSVTFTVIEKLGGTSTDHGYGIYALGDSVSILVGSARNNFPLGTGTPFQSSYGGSTDGFVARIKNDGTGGYKASYTGGSGTDMMVSVRPIVVSNQAALLCFGTSSSSNLPVTNYNAESFYSATNAGGQDMMFLICDMNLNTKYYLSYIGGTANDYLGATGVPVGSNHLFYNTVDSVLYVGTTTHSYESTQNPEFVGRGIADILNAGVPVFDEVKNNGTNDTHVIFALAANSIYSILAKNWINFKTNLNRDCGVQAVWEIADPNPASRYIVERSSDGRNFLAISESGGGLRRYSYTDPVVSQLSGYVFYRIRLIDAGGNISYSKVNTIKLCHSQLPNIKSYPTITKDNITIVISGLASSSSSEAFFQLYNAIGEIVMRKRIALSNGTQQVQFRNDLMSGNYFLLIKDPMTGSLFYQAKIIIDNN